MTQEFSPELSHEERDFLMKMRELVTTNNQMVDFDYLRQTAPTDHKGIFWLQFATELSAPIASPDAIDIRDNGRLRVALKVLRALLNGDNRQFAEVWAQRLIALSYWIGAQEMYAYQLAQSGKTEEANETFAEAHKVKNELYSTLETALEMFPEDEWFLDFKENHLPDKNVEEKSGEEEITAHLHPEEDHHHHDHGGGHKHIEIVVYK